MSSLKNMTLQTKTIDGITFSFVNESDFHYVYNENFKVNQYKFSARAASPFILDCGANIGISVLYFKKLYPQAKIVAFEPNPETFQLLELNIRQNNLMDVQLVNAAVSDSQGEMDFYVNGDDFCSWSLSDTGIKNAYAGPASWKTTKVPTVQLSSYITQHVDLLKLDIEGMEEIVLKEIEDKLGFIEEIRLEFHHNTANQVNNLDRMLVVLAKQQFKCAFERERKVINVKQIRHAMERNDNYLFLMYLHRRQSHVWWQAWFIPKALRVQNRVKRLMPGDRKYRHSISQT